MSIAANSGGILGLFMGFSFISIAEIVYFVFLRPIFKFVLPQKYRKSAILRRISGDFKVSSIYVIVSSFLRMTTEIIDFFVVLLFQENKNWLPEEICKASTKASFLERTLRQ